MDLIQMKNTRDEEIEAFFKSININENTSLYKNLTSKLQMHNGLPQVYSAIIEAVLSDNYSEKFHVVLACTYLIDALLIQDDIVDDGLFLEDLTALLLFLLNRVMQLFPQLLLGTNFTEFIIRMNKLHKYEKAFEKIPIDYNKYKQMSIEKSCFFYYILDSLDIKFDINKLKQATEMLVYGTQIYDDIKDLRRDIKDGNSSGLILYSSNNENYDTVISRHLPGLIKVYQNELEIVLRFNKEDIPQILISSLRQISKTFDNMVRVISEKYK